MILNSARKLLLKITLNACVYGSGKIISVNSVDIAGVFVWHFVSVGVTRLYIVSVSSSEVFIVLIFNTVKPYSVTAGKADNVRAKRISWVVSRALSLEEYHILKLVFLDKFPYGVRNLLVNLTHYGTVKIFGISRSLRINTVKADSEYFGKSLGYYRCVILVILAVRLSRICAYNRGGDKHTVGGYIGCENVSVSIVYLSAVSRNGRLRGHLIYYLGLILVKVDCLNNKNSYEQKGKHTENGKTHYCRASYRARAHRLLCHQCSPPQNILLWNQKIPRQFHNIICNEVGFYSVLFVYIYSKR